MSNNNEMTVGKHIARILDVEERYVSSPVKYLLQDEKRSDDIEDQWNSILGFMVSDWTRARRCRFKGLIVDFYELLESAGELSFVAMERALWWLDSHARLEASYQELWAWIEQSSYPTLENLPADC